MTNEEAIENLKCLFESTYVDRFEDAENEALKIAIKALEQEPCEDAISRDELLKAIDTWDKFGVDDTSSLFRLDNLSLPHYVPYIHYDDVVKCIKGMPPVNPQEPKTGHWIYDNYNWRCSECNETPKTLGYVGTADFMTEHFKFCNHCGAKMIEPQERSDKE